MCPSFDAWFLFLYVVDFRLQLNYCEFGVKSVRINVMLLSWIYIDDKFAKQLHHISVFWANRHHFAQNVQVSFMNWDGFPFMLYHENREVKTVGKVIFFLSAGLFFWGGWWQWQWQWECGRGGIMLLLPLLWRLTDFTWRSRSRIFRDVLSVIVVENTLQKRIGGRAVWFFCFVSSMLLSALPLGLRLEYSRVRIDNIQVVMVLMNASLDWESGSGSRAHLPQAPPL